MVQDSFRLANMKCRQNGVALWQHGEVINVIKTEHTHELLLENEIH